MTTSIPEAISSHAHSADAVVRKGFGPRVRKLHARIGAAHRKTESMVFSRALLEGQVSPLQLAALIRTLAPAYALIEELGPDLACALGAADLPWKALRRGAALEADQKALASLPATPASAAARAWLERLATLAQEAPHRFLAHVYVRYGGDLSGGQQLAEQANGILVGHGLRPLQFWHFDRPVADLKASFHDAYEQLELSEAEEAELLEEAETAFLATQALLAELAELEPAPAG